jgi:hypothetical protein
MQRGREKKNCISSQYNTASKTASRFNQKEFIKNYGELRPIKQLKKTWLL